MKAIPDHPDWLCNELGEVRHAITGKYARRATPSDSGYERVWLGKKRVLLHRIVLLAFVGAPPTARHHGAHNDGNKKNNTLPNLKWKAPTENEADKKLHGTAPRGGANYRPPPQIVGRIKNLVKQGRSFSSIAKSFGLHRSSVSRYARELRRAS